MPRRPQAATGGYAYRVLSYAAGHLHAGLKLLSKDHSAIISLIAASIALGACTRQPLPVTTPLPAPSLPAAEPAPVTVVQDDSMPWPASSIVVVAPSADLIRRAASAGPAIAKLLEAARPTIGTPYQWGGTDMARGIDCSNYTWLLYRSIGVSYQRYISTLNLASLHRSPAFTATTFDQALPGDLLVYRTMPG